MILWSGKVIYEVTDGKEIIVKLVIGAWCTFTLSNVTKDRGMNTDFVLPRTCCT